jgi:hypothetical protein
MLFLELLLWFVQKNAVHMLLIVKYFNLCVLKWCSLFLCNGWSGYVVREDVKFAK